jgi:hypothetical protein
MQMKARGAIRTGFFNQQIINLTEPPDGLSAAPTLKWYKPQARTFRDFLDGYYRYGAGGRGDGVFV